MVNNRGYNLRQSNSTVDFTKNDVIFESREIKSPYAVDWTQNDVSFSPMKSRRNRVAIESFEQRYQSLHVDTEMYEGRRKHYHSLHVDTEMYDGGPKQYQSLHVDTEMYEGRPKQYHSLHVDIEMYEGKPKQSHSLHVDTEMYEGGPKQSHSLHVDTEMSEERPKQYTHHSKSYATVTKDSPQQYPYTRRTSPPPGFLESNALMRTSTPTNHQRPSTIMFRSSPSSTMNGSILEERFQYNLIKSPTPPLEVSPNNSPPITLLQSSLWRVANQLYTAQRGSSAHQRYTDWEGSYYLNIFLPGGLNLSPTASSEEWKEYKDDIQLIALVEDIVEN